MTDILPPRDTTRARLYVGSLWGIAALSAYLATLGSAPARETGLGLAMLLPIALILYLVTWRDRGGHWLLGLFIAALALFEATNTVEGRPAAPGVFLTIIVVAWASAAFFLGEQLRRAGWLAP